VGECACACVCVCERMCERAYVRVCGYGVCVCVCVCGVFVVCVGGAGELFQVSGRSLYLFKQTLQTNTRRHTATKQTQTSSKVPLLVRFKIRKFRKPNQPKRTARVMASF